MEYYQEITILPESEMPTNFILSKVYQQLHIAFVEHQDAQGQVPYGVAFPEYQEEGERIGLGRKIRIFAADEKTLEDLSLSHVLQRYADYIHLKRTRRIPGQVKGYCCYCRYHQDGSRAQKARRYAKRHGITVEEAMQLFPKKGRPEYPYVQLTSATNGHKFRLYVRRIPVQSEENSGFSVYGLSSQSSLPVF